MTDVRMTDDSFLLRTPYFVNRTYNCHLPSVICHLKKFSAVYRGLFSP